MQRAARVRATGSEKLRHGGNVPHETGDVVESGAAQPLENITLPRIGDGKKGQIDMPLPVGVAEDRPAVQPK